MTEGGTMAWLAFVCAALLSGFITGYFVGYDRAMNKKKKDYQLENWYQWPCAKVPILDPKANEDFKVAKEIHDWLAQNVDENDFHPHVDSNLNNMYAYFYVRDKHIVVMLSLKFGTEIWRI